jgi:hypothetical protein
VASKKIKPTTTSAKRLAAALPQGVAMAHRLHVAVLKAVYRHKENGNTVAVWRDGDVVLVAPENIKVIPGNFEPVIG